MRESLRTGLKIGLLLGVAAGVIVSVAPTSDAARNASGTYTLPAGNPVVTGTTITSSWANSTLADLGAEVTNSLDRNGRGAMLAPVQCANGTVGAPSLTFASDTDTGLYRIGANNPAISAGGTKAQEWTATTTTIPVAVTASAGITTTGSTNGRGITATGNGTGLGGHFTGGATAGGIAATAGGGDSNGVYGVGTGLGAGVAGQAANAAASGVHGIAGGSSGWGVTATGASGGPGLRAHSSATNVPVIQADGYVDLNAATNPSSSTAFTDKITPGNIIKSWGRIAVGTGTPTVTAGFNISSVSCATNVVTVTFADDFSASTSYVVVASSAIGDAYAATYAAGTVNLEVQNPFGTPVNLCTTGSGLDVSFIAIGLQ